MQRRRFIKLFLAGSLGGAGLGLSGCEEYDFRSYGRYDYDYYPDSDVYYHSWTGSYYYYRDGIWIRTSKLPVHIVLKPFYRRRIRIIDRYPYLRNKEHRRRFPHRPHRHSPNDRLISDRERARIERRRERRRERARAERERLRRQGFRS